MCDNQDAEQERAESLMASVSTAGHRRARPRRGRSGPARRRYRQGLQVRRAPTPAQQSEGAGIALLGGIATTVDWSFREGRERITRKEPSALVQWAVRRASNRGLIAAPSGLHLSTPNLAHASLRAHPLGTRNHRPQGPVAGPASGDSSGASERARRGEPRGLARPESESSAVAGLRPCRAARWLTLNLPNPARATSPPLESSAEIDSITGSTTLRAGLRRDRRPARCAQQARFSSWHSFPPIGCSG